MSTVLVTGVTGNLGRELLPQLLNEGLKVVGCAKREPDFLKRFSNEGFIFEKVDLTVQAQVHSLFKKYRFDQIIHLAGVIKRDDISTKAKEEVFRANCIVTFNICSNLQKSKVKKVIFTSSMAVYGLPRYLPVDEEHVLKPLDFYGVSKVMSEEIITNFCSGLKIDYCILRLPSVLAKSDKSGAIYNFVRRAIKGTSLKININPRPWHFIDIKDATKAIVRSISIKKAVGVINVGYDQKMRIEDVGSKIIKIVNSKSKIVFLKKIKNPYFSFDTKKLKTTLGLKFPSVDQRLREYVSIFQKR